MTDASVWPRPGHVLVYHAQIELDGQRSFSYELSVPGTTERHNISTFIPGRIGGPHDGDVEMRRRLYGAVGQAVVAGGHIEASMKRLLILLQGKENRFALVDEQWSSLEKKLGREVRRTSGHLTYPELRGEVSELLDHAARKQLKRRRDSIVHGSFWDYDMPVLLLARFARREDGHTEVTSLENVEQTAAELYDYASRLDASLAGKWAEAMLPRDGRESPVT
jgi:hypothetical protein